MAQAEQEQQKGALCPRAQCCRAGRSHQHQGVDLEALEAQVVQCLPEGVETAKDIGQHETRPRQPIGCTAGQLLNAEPDAQQGAAAKGEIHLGVGAQQPPVLMLVCSFAWRVLML